MNRHQRQPGVGVLNRSRMADLSQINPSRAVQSPSLARQKQTRGEECHTAPIRVHATPRERSALEEEAARRGVSLSSFAHDLMFRRFAEAGRVAGTRQNPQAAALLRELNAIGINLNQLMRHGHQTGELGQQRLSEVDDVLLAIKQAASRVYEL